MKNLVTCPVCRNDHQLPENAEGTKWKCDACSSIHRVLEAGGGYELKTLEETLNWQRQEPALEMAMAADAADERGKAPVGPKLQTRRSKFNEETQQSSGSKRRLTRGSSRRSRLK